MLQCLFHLSVLRNFIANVNHDADWYRQLQQLFHGMNNDFSVRQDGFCSPKQFLDLFAFRMNSGSGWLTGSEKKPRTPR
jgi:hypothetical protein